MKKLKVLDLFSGIGGFSLGLEATGGFETIAFCEINPFCQKVLRKHWPHVPIVSDINKLSYNRKTKELIYDGEVIYVGTIDLITGGFPCQPFSCAGEQKGEEDDRHLWPIMFKIIQEVRPDWVIGENVVGLVELGLDDVLNDLEREAYTTRTFNIPACAAGAPHRRERLWIVANTSRVKSQRRTIEEIPIFTGLQVQLGRSGTSIGVRRHENESFIRGVDNGLPRQVDRLKSLGNAVMPHIPQIFGMAILEILN